MTESLPSPSTNRCSSAARRILSSRDWRLLSFPAIGVTWDEFVQRVCRRVAELIALGSRLPEDKLIEKAVVNQYCVLLHDALQSTELSLHNQVMTELRQYLLPMTRRKAPDLPAEDITMQTLLKIWREFRQKAHPLNDPGALLSWCTQILQRQILQHIRREARQPQATSFQSEEDNDGDDERFAVEPSPIADDALWMMIRRCLQDERELAIIAWVFFHDLSIKDIAARLQIRPNLASLKKFRALDRLRRCPELASWREEAHP